MTPLRAIRKICVDCVGSAYDVAGCGGGKCLDGQGDETGKCYFYLYRMGKGRPSVKLIRKFCLECMGDSRQLVRECESDCALHPYRFGRNPKRAGMGRKDAFKHIVSGGFSSQDERLAPGEGKSVG
jgi:hypothetical protein